MDFLFFAWLASVVYGLEVVIGKFTSNHTVTNPWLFNFVWSLFIIVLILPFALLNHVGLPHITPNFLLVTASYAVANILYILSLQLMDVTAMGPLFNFRSVFSVILGVVMLGESITPAQIAIMGIIFVAGILVNMDEKLKPTAFLRTGVLVLMVFLLVLAFNGIYTNLTIAESGFWTTTLWTMIASQILYLFTVPLFWTDMRRTNITRYGGLLLMSLASAGGTLAANQAYASNVGITSVIMSLPFSMIFTIAVSVVNPKLLEHHSPKVYVIRVVSAAVMLVAALRLAV